MPEKLRIDDIVKATGLGKSTLIRYEKEGKISRAKRDGRGWRWYTPKEKEDIVEKLKKLDLL